MSDAGFIAFQGIAGAHSDMACRVRYPYMETMSCNSFDDLFEAVENGKAQYGMVPIENSQAGRVAEIHNLLPRTSLHIIGEYFHKVEHHLLGVKGSSLNTIKTVNSHPQALMQCRNNIRKLSLEAKASYDTAGAAKDLATLNDPTQAAIGSELAAELYGLEILKRDFQDAANNVTIFIIVAREPIDPEPQEDEADYKILTSLIFTVRNIPAALYKAMGGFATNNVNMIKLESYISSESKEMAQFFLTFEGHPRERGVQLALEELGFFTKKVNVLGVYEADKARSKKVEDEAAKHSIFLK